MKEKYSRRPGSSMQKQVLKLDQGPKGISIIAETTELVMPDQFWSFLAFGLHVTFTRPMRPTMCLHTCARIQGIGS